MTDRPVSRRRLLVNGIVQGVGFRPFVYNLARGLELTGSVTNTSAGVVIEIQGPEAALVRFAARLADAPPPLARITSMTVSTLTPVGAEESFSILASANTPGTDTLIPPDIATCADCLREVLDPADRRCGYPFTNCTNCGPRWTIIDRVPYDRPFTSMAAFEMCKRCRAEYEDPGDRRFHAQPNACPECGPRVWLEDLDGEVPGRTPPLEAAAGLLAVGRILAIKGLGGFHLAVRADSPLAVTRLRRKKNREAKPLAVMVGDLAAARRLADLTPAEVEMLTSPQAPIVLAVARPDGPLAPGVAPGHRRLGLMLPYTPLHHLLFAHLRARGVPALVMTSGNAGDEPICLDNTEALERLKDIADSWILHDRDILRRADDSVLQVLPDGPLFFRRSRGFAPVPVFVPEREGGGPDVLGVGPELKNTVCLLSAGRGFLSPHIGDLQNLQACGFFGETTATLQKVLEKEPAIVAHDKHPDYFSTRWARERAGGREAVQHHHAHLAAVMAEHGRTVPVLGLILDGTGYGDDGTIWGGEILYGDFRECRRVGHLDPVPLPGGDAAVRAPWRMAVSHLRHACGATLPPLPFLAGLPTAAVMEMLDKNINSPLTSSCGRLFDAVAALTGRWSVADYEAQAAIELMAATDTQAVRAAADLVDEAPVFAPAGNDTPFIIPVAPLVRGVVAAVTAGATVPVISARFHRSLIDLLTAAAVEAARRTDCRDIALGGGVFQNEIMVTGMMDSLTAAGLKPFRPLALPANDGAVSLGQAVVAHFRS
jgi:hydrogenase maturation protein HypF